MLWLEPKNIFSYVGVVVALDFKHTTDTTKFNALSPLVKNCEVAFYSSSFHGLSWSILVAKLAQFSDEKISDS